MNRTTPTTGRAASGPLLDVTQAAERLNVRPRMIRRLKDRGELPFTKIGSHLRFYASDVDALALAGRVDFADEVARRWSR